MHTFDSTSAYYHKANDSCKESMFTLVCSKELSVKSTMKRSFGFDVRINQTPAQTRSLSVFRGDGASGADPCSGHVRPGQRYQGGRRR